MDPDGDIGEVHDPETYLIPMALAAAGTALPLNVFGNDYDTQDGTCARDYVHVSELAQAHVLALRWLLDGNPSRNFNFGNGQGSSVLDVIAAVRRVTGLNVPCTLVPRRAGDPPRLVADARSAVEQLGWRPQRSSLDVQITDIWNWFQRAKPSAGSLRRNSVKTPGFC